MAIVVDVDGTAQPVPVIMIAAKSPQDIVVMIDQLTQLRTTNNDFRMRFHTLTEVTFLTKDALIMTCNEEASFGISEQENGASRTFLWNERSEDWDAIISMLQTLTASAGHQYLSRHPWDAAMVIVSRGEGILGGM